MTTGLKYDNQNLYSSVSTVRGGGGRKYKQRANIAYHHVQQHADEIDDEDYTPSGRQTPSSTISDDLHSTSSRTSSALTTAAQRAAIAGTTTPATPATTNG